MALRSLAARLGNRLLRWAKVPPDVPPPASAAELDMTLKPIKLDASLGEGYLAFMKSLREEERLLLEESERLIRKEKRVTGIFAAASIGVVTFFWYRVEAALGEIYGEIYAGEDFAELFNAEEDDEVDAEKDDEVDAEEDGNEVDAKEGGDGVDTKEGKTMDEERV